MNATQLPILNYHGIQVRENEYGVSPAERKYFISKKSFRAQLEILRNEKFETLRSLELESIRSVSNRCVMLTFDDGHVSN